MNWKKPSIYIGAVLAALALILLIVFFLNPQSDSSPPISLPSASITDNLSPSDNLDNDALAEVTKENVQSIISNTLSRVESYHQTITTTLYSDGNEKSTEHEIWSKGTALRIESRSEDSTKSILVKDNTLYLWYDDDKSVYTKTVISSIPDEYIGLISYEDVVSIPAEKILDAGHVEFAGDSCIFVEYTDGELNYTQRLYISISNGLVMGEECYDGDSLIYSMVSAEPDISTPTDSVFALP